jgi:hypothetical protein
VLIDNVSVYIDWHSSIYPVSFLRRIFYVYYTFIESTTMKYLL